MHLLAAVALGLLALPTSRPASPLSFLTGFAALLASTCFLILSMSHFHGLPEIESTLQWCASDGRAALVAYNLIRVVALAGGIFALGSFLLLQSSDRLHSGKGSRTVHLIGVLAGILCLLFVFSGTPSTLITGLALGAILVWGISHIFLGKN